MLEHNWKQKSLEALEKVIVSQPQNEESSLIKTCNQLRKKPIQEFTIEDLRLMIGQEIGLEFLIPLAIEKLTLDILAEGDYYEGDLLKSVINVHSTFWKEHKSYWITLSNLLESRRNDLIDIPFDTSTFETLSI